MKLKLSIIAASMMCSLSANALVLPHDAKTLDRVSLYYMDWSDGATEQSQGFAFDTGAIKYSHAAISEWGEWVTNVDLLNVTESWDNAFDNMASITVSGFVHKNIGESNFNLWAQNTAAVSTVMTANDLYLGISYDLNFGHLQLKPSIGAHHSFGMASLPFDSGMELPTGVTAQHTDFSGYAGLVAGLTAQTPLMIGNQLFIASAGIDYQFARPEEFKDFVMVGRDSGYAFIGNLDWIISENLNAFVEYRYMNNYSVAMTGNAGGLAVGVGYSF